MASKIAGTFLRGGKFGLRIIAPKDLQARFYDGKRIAFNGSLGTGDPQVARVKAAAIRADFEAQFLAQRREMSPPKLAAVGPELRQCIVDTLLSEEAERDAAQRLDKTKSTGVYRAVVVGYEGEDGSPPDRPPLPPAPPLRPLSPTAVSARTAFNLRRQAMVREALATGNLEIMLPIVQPIAKRLGLAIDYETADGAQLLQEALAAYSAARGIAVQRDLGMVVPTPPTPTVSAAVAEVRASATKGTVHLRDIKADWVAIKTRTKAAINITDRALKLMTEAKVDVPLAELDRQHGSKLRAYLVATGIKGQSVKNLLVPLQSLLNVAVDSGKLKANPWAGLKIDTSDSIQRLPWRLEDLQKLTTANNERTDPARWLFPLALYSGCRAGEMAQAELADIQQIDGVWCLEVHGRVSAGNENRSVKTKAGERLIPISRHLVDLGFLNHVEASREAGARFVFPEFIGNGKRLPSDFASADFLKLREAADVQIDERFTLHSIRHNVRSALAAAHVNDQIIDKLVGHESGTVQGRYTHATTSTLAAAVERLDWVSLGLRPHPLGLPSVPPVTP